MVDPHRPPERSRGPGALDPSRRAYRSPAAELVPGPLDEDELPPPSAGDQDPGLPAAWLTWWAAIARDDDTVGARPDLDVLARDERLGPGVDGGLCVVVDRRFAEFRRWHGARKERGVRQWHEMLEQAGAHRWRAARRDDGSFRPDPLRETHLVADLERRLGQKAPPFVLDLVLLPVRDDVVREVRPDRYLVPERVYDGADWPRLLEPLVLQQFT